MKGIPASANDCGLKPLGRYRVAVSSDGTTWDKVVESWPDFGAALHLLSRFPPVFGFSHHGEIKMAFWTDVSEALEDLRDPPPPEQEFLMNATAHRRDKNYRLAVMESVISLEIVLTEYVTNYLTVHKKVPKKRVANFVPRSR
ncbi:MAG: hypothetical protein HYS34_08740 [Acidobacteria bacterium]|nr:hypothetical protein [Acidobacteriota bacterium]